MASTHMILVDADTDETAVREMVAEMKAVDGVKYVLGLESVVGERVPMEMLPSEVTDLLQNESLNHLLIKTKQE